MQKPQIKDSFLIALRCFIMIDEWGLYIMLIYLWQANEIAIFSIAAFFGSIFVFKGYMYYWMLLHQKHGEPPTKATKI